MSAGGDGYDVGEATLTGAAAVAGTWSVGDQIGPGIDSWTPVSGTSHVVVYVGSGSGAVTIAEPLFGGGSVVKYGTIVTPTSCPPNTTGITLNLREGGTLSGVKYDEDMGTNQTLTAGMLVQVVQVTESGSTFWRIAIWPCPSS